MTIAIVLLIAVAAIFVGWRLYSRRAVMPCPASLAFLVELENPLAKATRSASILGRLNVKPGDRVLDLGCGPGRVTLPLARAVGPSGEVIALDLQDKMLAKVADKAARENHANIRPLQSDARTAALAENSLDAVVAAMALGEIPDYPTMLPIVLAALKPGGRFLVAESTFDPHYVPIAKLRNLAEAAGFTDRGYSGNLFGYSVLFEKPAQVAPLAA